MSIFRRRPRLPADLRPVLGRDERVVAWAWQDETLPPPSAAQPHAVVATNLGLFLPGRDGRLGWHQIHKATWGGRQLTVTPAEVVEERAGYLVTTDGPPTTVGLREPGDVPQVVRTRVTRSVSITSHHTLPGGGVRVVARRVPGMDGLTWAVRYDDGTDPGGPGIAEATARLVAQHTAATADPLR